MEPDWGAIRAEFPALRNWTYLNTATYGQVPRAAAAAMARHMAHRDELACSDFLSWFDDADALRADLGRLIGCAGADIAFLPTASAALSLLIGALDWQAGDRVVTLENEFPNNIYYPALLEGRGVEFVETGWERFWDAVTPRTRLVAISSVSYITGFRAPLEDIARELDRRGILFYVDGTQSVGALRMNVGGSEEHAQDGAPARPEPADSAGSGRPARRDLCAFRPAMMAVDAYKWMLTPNGAGFAYVHPRTRAWMKPHVVGWRSHHDWRAVDNLHTGAPEFSEMAEKYEGGMLPFPMLYALHEVAKMMLAIGPEAIERRVTALAADLRARIGRLGGRVLHDGAQVVAARFDGVDASALARKLKEQRVLVSARHGNLRVSVHFYNNEEDLERLERAIREA